MRPIPQRTERMLLIKNGRVLDPATKTDATLDVLLDGDTFRKRVRISRPMAPRFSMRRA